jgi:hypothetical protein
MSDDKTFEKVHGMSTAIEDLSDNKKAYEDVHGIFTAGEDPARVAAGYGKTTNIEGAKTKEVHNVSWS